MARKPKIFKTKYEICSLIKKRYQSSLIDYHSWSHGWKGRIFFESRWIHIYLQRYVRKMGVDHIDIRDARGRALRPAEIRHMLYILKRNLNQS